MPENFEEGLKEVPQEQLSEELKGKIVDDIKGPNKKRIALVSSLVALGFGSIAGLYFYNQETKEEILERKLQTPSAVKSMFFHAKKVVQNPNIKKQELKEAINTLLDVSMTQLRKEQDPLSPYIQEKYGALVEALEGLLRFKVEGWLGFGIEEDEIWYQNCLEKIGLHQLEYYESGVVKRLPLMRSSIVKAKVQAEKESIGIVDLQEIDNLYKDLEKLKEEESFSVVRPAYLIGAFYRYHNHLEEAKRCFEIARRYVEGYQKDQTFYPGTFPKSLNPLFDEYSLALEALAEIAFQQQKYREARSYLIRIANTPNVTTSFDRQKLSSFRHSQVREEIKQLEHDKEILQAALKFPLELNSFPFFEEESQIILWDQIALTLKNQKRALADTNQELLQFIEKKINPEVLKEGIENSSSDRFQKAFIIALNECINDPIFFKQISFDPQKLSKTGKSFFEKSLKEPITDKEEKFLNRDIIDHELSFALRSPLKLSCGLRIHNGLNEEQTAALIEVYQQKLHSAQLGLVHKQQISKRVHEIQNHIQPATLKEFYQLLDEEKNRQKKLIQHSVLNYQKNKSALIQIQNSIVTLEKSSQFNLSSLLKMQRQQKEFEMILNREDHKQKEATRKLEKIQYQLSLLSSPIEKRLQGIKLRLSVLQQEVGDSQKNQNTDSILEQIETQIALKQEFLVLLEEIRKNQEDHLLKELKEQRALVEAEIQELKEHLPKLKGDDREILQGRLGRAKDQLVDILKELNARTLPLKNIIDQISSQEESVLSSEKELFVIREKISKLIGTKNIQGSLDHKIQKRDKLLLSKNDSSNHKGDHHQKEIQRLTEEIAKEQRELSLLLRKERQIKENLEIFFPHLTLKGENQKELNAITQLKHYLSHQQGLLELYESYSLESKTRKEIFDNEKLIKDSFLLITDHLHKQDELSEESVLALSRAIHQILESNRLLEQNRRILEALKNKNSNFSIEQTLGLGTKLSQTERFQIEQAMGLTIFDYQKAFEAQNRCLEELSYVIKQKNQLEQEKMEAIHQRDQLKVDELLPKIQEKELLLLSLAKEKKSIHRKLKQLANSYLQKSDVIASYQQSILPKIEKIESAMEELTVEIHGNDLKLVELRDLIFQSALKIDQSLSQVELDELSNIDQIIEKEKKEIEHLKRAESIKQKELFYSSKALFLIAKSYYQQSLIDNHTELLSSQEVLPNILEAEKKYGAFLLREYDQKDLSQNIFAEQVSAEDQKVIHFGMWKDFLEKESLHFLEELLPKYTYLPKISLDNQKLAKRVQKVESIIAKSKFTIGKIHLNRALHFIKTMETPARDNPQAVKELDLASNAFHRFLDFTKELTQSKKPLTSTQFGSQEFPQKKRYLLKLDDDAKVYLGVIAEMRSQHLQAIGYYREILAVLSGFEKTHDALDPIVMQPYQYTIQSHPYYTSLLAKHDLAHETLYRLGKNYDILAQEAKDLAKKSGVQKPREHLERFNNYASHAIAYYSQLILNHSYSPMRKAALLKRALLWKEMGHYEESRNDFIALLGAPSDIGGSFSLAKMNSRGDLEGELDPGYSYISFELGKLHFENHNYMAAQEAFLQAKSSFQEDDYALKAKIAYAQTLIATESWQMAELFINQLIEEKRKAPPKRDHLYPPELFIDLAIAQKKMGNLNIAKQTLNHVLLIAPKALQKNGTLEIATPQALQMLKSDYKDAIRPIALSFLERAEIELQMRQYDEAKNSFKKASLLFQITPFKEDRLLRHLKKEEYEKYRSHKILATEWGELKAEALELIFYTFQEYRGRIQTFSAPLDSPNQLIATLEEALFENSLMKEEFEKLALKITRFYEKKEKELPEKLAQEHIEKVRALDLQTGGQKQLRYQALKNIKLQISQDTQEYLPSEFLKELKKSFGSETIEHQILNEFVIFFATETPLSEEDRSFMRSGKSNIDNLLAIPTIDQRFTLFEKMLKSWLRVEMKASGVDDLFIPLSPQGKILEEAALYQVALLSHLEDSQSYHQMVRVTDAMLSKWQIEEKRIQDEIMSTQLLEIAAMHAEHQRDWLKTISYNRALIQLGKKEVLKKEKAQLSLATALLEISKRHFEDIVFILDEEERQNLEKRALEEIEEAKNLLKQLKESSGQDSLQMTTRIRAKQLLSEIGA